MNIFDKIFGCDSRQSGHTLDCIGLVYKSIGEYDKSLEYYFKLLNISDKIFGRDSRQSAETLHNIGNVHFSKGEHDKSLGYYFKSLNIRDKIFGRDSRQSADTLHNIGSVYESKGEHDKSLKYLFKSLNIFDKIFGSNSLEYLFKFLNITDTTFGNDSHQYSETLKNIGKVFFSRREFDKSLDYLLKSLNITDLIFEYDSSQSSDTLMTIGAVYFSKGEHDKVLKYLLEILNIRDNFFGCDSRQSAELLNYIGSVYFSKGEYDKSLEYTFNLLNISDYKLNIFDKSDSGPSFKTLLNIGIVYSSKGEYDKSLEYLFKSLNISDKKFGSNAHQSFDILNNIGLAYNSKREYNKSLEYLFKSLNITDKIFGCDSQQSFETLDYIGLVYSSIGERGQSLQQVEEVKTLENNSRTISIPKDNQKNLNNKSEVNLSTCGSERDLLFSFTKDNIIPVQRSDIFENSEYSSTFYYYLKQHTKFLLKQSKFSECSSVWIKASELLMDDQPIISIKYINRAIKSLRTTHDDFEFKKIAELCEKQFQLFNREKNWKMAENMLQLIGKIPMQYFPQSQLPTTVDTDWKMNSDLVKKLQYCKKLIDDLQWLGWKSFHGDHSKKNIHKGSVIMRKLVVCLILLLQQGITRFARKFIRIPNDTLIPHFNSLENLLEQHSTKKVYPEIEALVKDINTKDWYKTLMAISNRFKHVCLDIPLKEDYEEFFSKNKAGSFPVYYITSDDETSKYTIDIVALLNESAVKQIQLALEKLSS